MEDSNNPSTPFAMPLIQKVTNVDANYIDLLIYIYITPGTVSSMMWYRSIRSLSSLKNINKQFLCEYKKMIQIETAVCHSFDKKAVAF